jgi:curved DNA-binding protein CbpA
MTDAAAFNPYHILGVPREASEAEIRQAFRHKARTEHPDAGGSPDAFQRLKDAYDILSDPLRRQHYDRTGTSEPAALDQHTAQIRDIIAAGLDQALFKSGADPDYAKGRDILQLTIAEIAERRQAWRAECGHYEEALQVARQLADRFKVSDGRNLMNEAVSSRIAICETEMARLTAHIALADEALAALGRTIFQHPQQISQGAGSPAAAPATSADQAALLDWSTLVKF